MVNIYNTCHYHHRLISVYISAARGSVPVGQEGPEQRSATRAPVLALSRVVTSGVASCAYYRHAMPTAVLGDPFESQRGSSLRAQLMSKLTISFSHYSFCNSHGKAGTSRCWCRKRFYNRMRKMIGFISRRGRYSRFRRTKLKDLEIIGQVFTEVSTCSY